MVEQPGRIVVLKRGKRQAKPFLDIRGRVDYEGERGLLSVAFPPDYKASGDFYVYYVDKRGSTPDRRIPARRARPGRRRARGAA